MKKTSEFTYNGRYCSIMFSDKNFYLALFKDKERVYTDKFIKLFPSERYSKGKMETAFDVANLLVLPNIESF